MKQNHVVVHAIAALTVIAGLSGCGDDTGNHSAHPSSTAAPTTSAQVVAPTSEMAEPTRESATSTARATTRTTSTTPDEPVADVDCGPVTDAVGGTRTVIAVGSPDGRPGCTEAIDVASTYVTTIQPSDELEVDGWDCHAQPDPAVPSICEKDGLTIALRAN
ncbi:hypothetical protein [Nocardia caishijiensis]|uniref:Secreted protein n=1 Tax=Nocardia caishijiensis TaxID=184756 RepID=A0ABQ6YUE9_9NOCA|nr:hypothetical protein [Nocardia caishijiensis]KAF0849432.1 hypothetical protein FNL39_101871 [Nocardia caishijiensis]